MVADTDYYNKWASEAAVGGLDRLAKYGIKFYSRSAAYFPPCAPYPTEPSTCVRATVVL